MRRLAVIALCVGCVSALAPAVFGASELNVNVKEHALPSIGGQPYRPRLSGDWVVTVRNFEKRAENVIAINVATNKAYTLFDIADGTSIFPSISGNIVVWTGKSDQVPSLRGKRGQRGQLNASMIFYDLTTGRYYAPELNTISAFYCSVSGKYIAYELGSRIYLYDVSNRSQMRISDDNPYHHSPEMSGDLVVWGAQASESAKRQVYAYRLSTGQQTQITDEPNMDCCGAQTDGRYIVWWDKTGAHVYDTTNKSTFTIPKAYFPAVDGGIVVYQRPEGQSNPVFGMYIATRKEFRISSGTANIGPDISGKRVIWCSGETIYCADLNDSLTGPGVHPSN